MPFVLNQRYSRQAIHDQLGGDLQSYLPRVRGEVVCGCFDPDINARAAFEIDLGEGRDVIRYAEKLHQQATAVPVFLRRDNLGWEYLGNFAATALTRDQSDLYPAVSHRRPDARAVLYLTENEPSPFDATTGREIDLPASALEGAVQMRTHLRRERSPALVEAKRRSYRAENGGLQCQVCAMLESQLPRALAEACFEVHHLQPLAARAAPVETRLDELAIVCANCHRMLHRSQPMLTVPELSRLINGDA